ncbi:family 43 glycosylhydrolase [Promicromonospora iranensis]|uniref:family 43 glycosylhydrolase n=1 Tax=Promicromonospora iranensis TaxID=1105144 RepID=UPI0023A994B2|nr:family 43 glycosylhydrolase [Promicromonospora iranensis]
MSRAFSRALVAGPAVAALTLGLLTTGSAAATPAAAPSPAATPAATPAAGAAASSDVAAAAGDDVAAQATVRPSLVLDRDFPDPDVSKFGDTYYAYATNEGKNLPWATAPDPDGPWTYRSTDALPDLGAWAKEGRTWAPDVSRRSDGRYLLYYTAWHAASDRQCIGAALSDSPGGPFAPVGTQPLVCPLDAGGAIDASSFVDTDGTRYLVWKNDGNAIGATTWIHVQRVAADGITFQGGATQVLRNDRADEAGIIEAPVITKVGGRYVLFYSAGPYTTNQYGTSYAVSSSITGPYTKAFRFLMTTDSLDGAVGGPGGADVLRDAGGDKLVFHGHRAAGGRGMYVADLGWADGYPVVRGSRVRYEAERGTLNNCSVRENAAGASDGKVVAYIDHADSFVDVGSIYVPTTGSYSLHVGYANGSAGTASHTVTVNGAAAGSISYPVTGWDTWRQATKDVTLQAGWNTIRLGKGTAFTEVDYIEVA